MAASQDLSGLLPESPEPLLLIGMNGCFSLEEAEVSRGVSPPCLRGSCSKARQNKMLLFKALEVHEAHFASL